MNLQKSKIFLFEFMDQAWVAKSLRITMRELLEAIGSMPPFYYYRWASEKILKICRREGIQNVIELGAGSAPITRELLKPEYKYDFKLHVTDILPDHSSFKKLAEDSQGKVTAHLEPIDFSRHNNWPKKTLLVLSATFHHIPYRERTKVLRHLTKQAHRTLILEPIRKNFLSMGLCFLSFFLSFLLPLINIKRQGHCRRVFWCWLFPVAGSLLVWDGIISCLRGYSDEQFIENLRPISYPRKIESYGTKLYQNIHW